MGRDRTSAASLPASRHHDRLVDPPSTATLVRRAEWTVRRRSPRLDPMEVDVLNSLHYVRRMTQSGSRSYVVRARLSERQLQRRARLTRAVAGP